MPLIELSTALVAAGSSVVVPFVNKVLEKTASRMGESVDSGLVQFFVKAHDNVIATGRLPQSVEPKIAVPLLQAVSLETDETLIDMWAALLANAADPSAKESVTVKFVEILRLLSPAEVKILKHLDNKRAEELFDFTIHLDTLATRLGIAERGFEIAADSLLSSRLCELPHDEFSIDANGDLIQRTPSKEELRLSSLGTAFLNAVTPPTP